MAGSLTVVLLSLTLLALVGAQSSTPPDTVIYGVRVLHAYPSQQYPSALFRAVLNNTTFIGSCTAKYSEFCTLGNYSQADFNKATGPTSLTLGVYNVDGTSIYNATFASFNNTPATWNFVVAPKADGNGILVTGFTVFFQPTDNVVAFWNYASSENISVTFGTTVLTPIGYDEEKETAAAIGTFVLSATTLTSNQTATFPALSIGSVADWSVYVIGRFGDATFPPQAVPLTPWDFQADQKTIFQQKWFWIVVGSVSGVLLLAIIIFGVMACQQHAKTSEYSRIE
jgi:hypothetical protein